MEIYVETTPTLPLDGRISKRCFVRVSPKKNHCAGNFSKDQKTFSVLDQCSSAMHKDINVSAVRRHSKSLEHSIDEFDHHVLPSDNPTYEDPRDVILREKPPKARRARTDAVVVPAHSEPSLKDSERSLKDCGRSLKEYKRKLSKKYESLIVGLMERCDENVSMLSEKDAHIAKLREKLKSVLEYNRMFAEENDRLRLQAGAGEGAGAAGGEGGGCRRCERLETRARELEEELSRCQPVRDPGTTTVPLVEVCVRCAARQVSLTQLTEQNARLHADVVAAKDLLYRLNVQLAKYQAGRGAQEPRRPSDVDALIAAAHESISAGTVKSGAVTPPRVAELSSLLSAQALVPLFDAYQDNIQEKETLIMDYEKQFESINKKSKQMIEDNKTLQQKLAALEEEVLSLSKTNRKVSLEKETMEIEKKSLVERVEKAEAKLAEVYDLYEGKVQAMVRDYETLHREYFAARARLAAADGKMARVVPADMHERRVADCTRLLEELKHQYGMQSERKARQLEQLQTSVAQLQAGAAELQARAAAADDRRAQLETECDGLRTELKAAQKSCKLYRKAAEVFRARLRRARSRPAAPAAPAAPTAPAALHRLAAIKEEIKQVKSRAYTSLEELERRMRYQETSAARELDRAHAALRHRDAVIRRLIDNVADIEEVRLSQTDAHQRLQGIQSETPENSPEDLKKERRLAPGPGGCYQDTRRERRSSNR